MTFSTILLGTEGNNQWKAAPRNVPQFVTVAPRPSRIQSILFFDLFKFNKYLLFHKRTAHIDKNDKKFKCDLCDYTSYAKRYISDHKIKVHDNRDLKHMCHKCGEKFKYPYYLRVHICPDRQLSHEELKCVECGHKFTASKYYMRHFLRLLETSRFLNFQNLVYWLYT